MPKQEERLQRAIVDYLELVAPQALVMAIPNAARRTPGRRPPNAVPGLLSGAPDLVIALANGRTIWIELKRPGGGRLSDAQLAVLSRLRNMEHEAYVVRSIDAMRTLLDYLGIETREAD